MGTKISMKKEIKMNKKLELYMKIQEMFHKNQISIQNQKLIL